MKKIIISLFLIFGILFNGSVFAENKINKEEFKIYKNMFENNYAFDNYSYILKLKFGGEEIVCDKKYIKGHYEPKDEGLCEKIDIKYIYRYREINENIKYDDKYSIPKEGLLNIPILGKINYEIEEFKLGEEEIKKYNKINELKLAYNKLDKKILEEYNKNLGLCEEIKNITPDNLINLEYKIYKNGEYKKDFLKDGNKISSGINGICDGFVPKDFKKYKREYIRSIYNNIGNEKYEYPDSRKNVYSFDSEGNKVSNKNYEEFVNEKLKELMKNSTRYIVIKFKKDNNNIISKFELYYLGKKEMGFEILSYGINTKIGNNEINILKRNLIATKLILIKQIKFKKYISKIDKLVSKLSKVKLEKVNKKLEKINLNDLKYKKYKFLLNYIKIKVKLEILEKNKK